MRVPLNWLKEYVELELGPSELADKLTNAGLEVSSVEHLDRGLQGVVTGEIVSLAPHPSSDHLLVAQIDLGRLGKRQVVTGAPNVARGQKVAVALPGASPPNLGPVREVRLRGIVSEAVVCSAWELGLEGHRQEEGILVFPPSTPVGEPVATHLGLDDTVLEIDVTPNRADCLGLVNLAREVAAITGGKLRLPRPELPTASEPASAYASVVVEATDLCPRYVAVVIRGLELGPSPEWMQHRLRAAGMRPINNVVDITNYVMLELGQPLHAFDYERIEGHKIIVRRAREGERLRTLDGVERQLTPEMLVIADAERAIALAGIMGGEETEINDRTTWVLLESASFSGANIRRSARALGMRSEASLRFERGVDPELAPLAARRAAALMAELAQGEVLDGFLDVDHRTAVAVSVDLSVKRTNALLGVELSREEIKGCLERLGLDCREEGENLKVNIPSYRADLRLPEDLVEEVGRLYGYERIPAVFPPVIGAEPKQNPKQEFLSRSRHLLADLGFREVLTYSFISPRSLELLKAGPGHPWASTLALRNPLGEEQSVMRPTLVPGLLQTAASNAAWGSGAFRFFELGKVFLPREPGGLPEEEWRLGALVGGEDPKEWNRPARPLDFFYLKGVLERFLAFWGLSEGLEFASGPEWAALHPGRRCRVLYGGEEMGWLAELHPGVLEDFSLPDRVCLLELTLEKIFAVAVEVRRRYRPWARYPAVARDIAVLVPEAVTHAQVRQAITRYGGDLLRGVRLFDVYRGGSVPEGYKSLAYRMVFQSEDHTLTEKEVSTVCERIVGGLEEEVGARLRS
ncbi:MAG: phenylalanine--tRNA ligase subunit beta [Clostridia bacterium]|jgi:phenylalanyl-tRNA synthetase beta chain|nr:phenylalanine--tRNA ligase subunit beta [Clostridia bacterium]MDH7573743.1 phenylalanine--tRNA ligase subunit beta [Clostridia bacterium]